MHCLCLKSLKSSPSLILIAAKRFEALTCVERCSRRFLLLSSGQPLASSELLKRMFELKFISCSGRPWWGGADESRAETQRVSS